MQFVGFDIKMNKHVFLFLFIKVTLLVFGKSFLKYGGTFLFLLSIVIIIIIIIMIIIIIIISKRQTNKNTVLQSAKCFNYLNTSMGMVVNFLILPDQNLNCQYKYQ